MKISKIHYLMNLMNRKNICLHPHWWMPLVAFRNEKISVSTFLWQLSEWLSVMVARIIIYKCNFEVQIINIEARRIVQETQCTLPWRTMTKRCVFQSHRWICTFSQEVWPKGVKRSNKIIIQLFLGNLSFFRCIDIDIVLE